MYFLGRSRSVRKESPANGHTNSQKKPLRPQCHNPMAEIRGQRKGRNQTVAQRRSHTLGEDGYPQILQAEVGTTRRSSSTDGLLSRLTGRLQRPFCVSKENSVVVWYVADGRRKGGRDSKADNTRGLRGQQSAKSDHLGALLKTIGDKTIDVTVDIATPPSGIQYLSQAVDCDHLFPRATDRSTRKQLRAGYHRNEEQRNNPFQGLSNSPATKRKPKQDGKAAATVGLAGGRGGCGGEGKQLQGRE
ncbi:hypothetical protein HCEG_00685 [Histoplasma capsulatum var. duboisii H88]|uniref:Uncharacterized protein n=2 Tax=Ajellomyces capsulatus TaxID=5037 RepID=F0U5H5_AJEC8|nr:hypothetical protein HCDG_00959 [Histoplasma capsulatum H143]EGC41323.1 hypothetical protein HCEG_00685 [Histoplasma capsulatum var. duboisii H88]